MSIGGIETKYQNYKLSSNTSTNSSNSASAFDSFQNELVNWEKRVKETIDKEQANDNSGSLLMSEKCWHALMTKVDNAIDSLESDVKKQEKGKKEQVEEKNLAPKDIVNVNIQTHNANIHALI